MFFDFYAGSTSRFDAHSYNAFQELLAAFPTSEGVKGQRVWGEWDGEIENTVQITADLPTDALAQRVAYALSVVTGNDAILVSRLATAHESEDSFTSTARYRANVETRSEGNRTMLSNPATRGFTDGPYGIAYVPDVRGSHVAYIVSKYATIRKVA